MGTRFSSHMRQRLCSKFQQNSSHTSRPQRGHPNVIACGPSRLWHKAQRRFVIRLNRAAREISANRTGGSVHVTVPVCRAAVSTARETQKVAVSTAGSIHHCPNWTSHREATNGVAIPTNSITTISGTLPAMPAIKSTVNAIASNPATCATVPERAVIILFYRVW